MPGSVRSEEPLLRFNFGVSGWIVLLAQLVGPLLDVYLLKAYSMSQFKTVFSDAVHSESPREILGADTLQRLLANMDAT
jgi:hypothetical protein